MRNFNCIYFCSTFGQHMWTLERRLHPLTRPTKLNRTSVMTSRVFVFHPSMSTLSETSVSHIDGDVALDASRSEKIEWKTQQYSSSAMIWYTVALTCILTCYIKQYPVAKCAQTARAMYRRRHNLPGSISICSRSIPEKYDYNINLSVHFVLTPQMWMCELLIHKSEQIEYTGINSQSLGLLVLSEDTFDSKLMLYWRCRNNI